MRIGRKLRHANRLLGRMLVGVGAATGTTVLALAIGVAPAQSHSSLTGHGGASCNTGFHVVTVSKTAGITEHLQRHGADIWDADWKNVHPFDPWWQYSSTHFPQSVWDWGVTATVFESHHTTCWHSPS